MKIGLKLIIKEFDELENKVSQAEYILEEHLFIDDEEKTAHQKCAEFLENKVFTPYLAWDGTIYPKIEVERIMIK